MNHSPRQLVAHAMQNQEPGAVPVFCQLAIGHTLLNTGVEPVAFNFTNAGYVAGLLKIRERYDFDGVLLHKPGRDESVLKRAERETTREGELLTFADGGRLLCPSDDDPKYWPPEDWQPGSALKRRELDAAAVFNRLELDEVLARLPPSYRDWCTYKGLHFHTEAAAFPAHYFTAIDAVLEATGRRYSVHGEIKAPSDYLVNLLGIEQTMLAFMMEPELCHRLLARAAEAGAAWALAQLRRGCDAIKLSSPYAGGGFISREHYAEFVLPYERKIAEVVRAADGVIYTHTCGAIGDRLDLLADSGVHGIESLDPPPLGNVELRDAVAGYGDRLFIKGNVDSVNVLLRGDREAVRRATQDCLDAGAAGGGYILSTACSVAPPVPPENLAALVETVRRHNAQGA